MAGPSDKWRDREEAARGQTFQTDFGRDRSDELNISESKDYPMKGGADNLSMTIKDGKVPRD
jgi:hypothetical protein